LERIKKPQLVVARKGGEGGKGPVEKKRNKQLRRGMEHYIKKEGKKDAPDNLMKT